MKLEHGTYYFVPAAELKTVLDELNRQGFQWRELGIGGSPMEKYYQGAITRDYGMMIPVLDVEIYKHYKFVTLTTDVLLTINNNKHKIESYEELKKRIKI